MARNRLESDPTGEHRRGCVVTRSDLDGMSLDVAVSAAVASLTGVNVLELDPVSQVVDAHALEEIWAQSNEGKWDEKTRVTFPYMGYRVCVTPGELHLEPRPNESRDGELPEDEPGDDRAPTDESRDDGTDLA